jgi:tRNA 2-selenouridine synthase
MPLQIDDFLRFRNEKTMVDVRSPGEFGSGHIRGAVNIPILNNEERVIVGTAYKKQGQKQAIKEGFRLVGPRLADIISETEKVSGGKEILVHCWRGGMRSNNFCQFVGMAGVRTQALQGGYKAYRQKAITSFLSAFQFVSISGYTGSGKSEILRELKNQGEQVIDLEALANHKGSAFGGLSMPAQPTTEQFQNELFEEIFKLDLTKRIWIEDESLSIGKIYLPSPFWKSMYESPLIKIEMDKKVRIERLVKEYGSVNQADFLKAMEQITKRLGGQHFNAAKERLLIGDMAGTIDILLTYYDKAYLHGLEKRTERIDRYVPWDGENTSELARELAHTNIR